MAVIEEVATDYTILRMRIDGYEVEDIADIVDVPILDVRRVLEGKGRKMTKRMRDKAIRMRYDRIVELRSEGWRLKNIAEMTMVSVETVRNVLKKRGDPLNGKLGWNVKKELRIVAALKDDVNKTFKEVATDLGVTMHAVKTAANRYGVARRVHRRWAAMEAMHESGMTQYQIAEEFGVTQPCVSLGLRKLQKFREKMGLTK